MSIAFLLLARLLHTILVEDTLTNIVSFFLFVCLLHFIRA